MRDTFPFINDLLSSRSSSKFWGFENGIRMWPRWRKSCEHIFIFWLVSEINDALFWSAGSRTYSYIYEGVIMSDVKHMAYFIFDRLILPRHISIKFVWLRQGPIALNKLGKLKQHIYSHICAGFSTSSSPVSIYAIYSLEHNNEWLRLPRCSVPSYLDPVGLGFIAFWLLCVSFALHSPRRSVKGNVTAYQVFCDFFVFIGEIAIPMKIRGFSIQGLLYISEDSIRDAYPMSPGSVCPNLSGIHRTMNQMLTMNFQEYNRFHETPFLYFD